MFIFHKEVSFCGWQNSKNGHTYYWILRKVDNITFVKDTKWKINSKFL